MPRRRLREEDESEINLTPMLDVVFIMLIFFIVTASFVKEAGIDVSRPPAATAERKERGKLVSRRQYLASQSIGVSGFADVIEEKDGILHPVEYKKGRTGNWLNDKVQLCLQGLLIEEATGKNVPFGYIYYISSNRTWHLNSSNQRLYGFKSWTFNFQVKFSRRQEK